MLRLCHRFSISTNLFVLSSVNKTKSTTTLRVTETSMLCRFSSAYEQVVENGKVRQKKKLVNALKKAKTKIVQIRPGMSIKELASVMEKPSDHVVACLDQLNYAKGVSKFENWTINNFDVIAKVVKLSGMRFQTAEPEKVDFDKIESELTRQNETRDSRPRPKPNELVKRRPVVTIMGHVDHGKTTLLDSLRGTNTVASEFGGITQHIGAFNCTLADGDGATATKRSITFLDTPGHAVFSEMRFRGAKVTDIVVLVVAAEDGIMAQTAECIEFAKKSRCPIIVAINKIDKAPPARIDQIKKDLLKYELICEEFGGDVQVVPISALKKTNLERLKEEIWTLAEIMELKGDSKGLVEGFILESSQDAHRGKLATVLVQRGTLAKAQFLVAGTSWCKIKSLSDENGQSVNRAGVSEAVQVMGWRELPNAGDEVLQVQSEHRAKELVDVRVRLEHLKKERQDTELIRLKRKEHESFYHEKLRERRTLGRSNRVDFEQFYGSQTVGLKPDMTHFHNEPKSLNIIIKTDVDGSLEAILNVLETYPNSTNEVKINIIHFEVGPLKKSDLDLAETFDALVYCFNLPPNPTLEQQQHHHQQHHKSEQSHDSSSLSSQHGKSIVRHFNVIYKLFDDLKIELNLRAPLVEEEEKVGEAEVLKVFEYEESSKKVIQVAGGRCLDGSIEKKSLFRITRNGQVLFEREVCKSLKHLKNDVLSVKRNVEFGLAFENEKVSVQSGDRIYCYSIKMVKRPVQWDLGF